MAQDYPDGFRRNLPGHTVDLESGFSLPWCESGELTIAAAGNSSFTLSFNDPDFIYFVDMINVSPQAYTEFFIFVYVNDVVYMAGANMGFLIMPLRTNPSINFISGDSIKIQVYNKDASQRTFKVYINGSKIARPDSYGHVPFPSFTPSAYSAAPGTNITFTDASTNTPTAWEWDFDDGSALGTEQNPVHAYSAIGSYYPRLKVSNQYGYDVYALSTPIIISTWVDVSGFTEVDAGSYISLSTYRVTTTSMPTNSNSYVYKDYTAGYFSAVSHKFSFKITSMSMSNTLLFIYGLSNSVGNLYSGAGVKVVLYCTNISGAYRLYLRLYNSTSIYTEDYMSISLNTTYYVQVLHTAGTTIFTVNVYSDSEYSSLIDTLTINSSYCNTSFRYLYIQSGVGAGVADVVSGYSENFLL